MGTTLFRSAQQVTTRFRDEIRPNAVILLHDMSMTALDRPSEGRPARLYWGGRQAQARALRYPMEQIDSPGARSTVSKAVQELIRAGVIMKVDGGFSGRSATYELLFRGDRVSDELLLPRSAQERLAALDDFSSALSTGVPDPLLAGGGR